VPNAFEPTANELIILEIKRQRDHFHFGFPFLESGTPPNLGEVCHLIRTRVDRSLEEVASKVGCSLPTFINWERGRGSCDRLWEYWAGLGWSLRQSKVTDGEQE